MLLNETIANVLYFWHPDHTAHKYLFCAHAHTYKSPPRLFTVVETSTYF